MRLIVLSLAKRTNLSGHIEELSETEKEVARSMGLIVNQYLIDPNLFVINKFLFQLMFFKTLSNWRLKIQHMFYRTDYSCINSRLWTMDETIMFGKNTPDRIGE